MSAMTEVSLEHINEYIKLANITWWYNWESIMILDRKPITKCLIEHLTLMRLLRHTTHLHNENPNPSMFGKMGHVNQ